MTVLRLTSGLGVDDGSYQEVVPFPVEVLDREGTVLAEGAVSADRVREFSIPDSYREVYVRASLPSGEQQTQRVALDTGLPRDVKLFSDRASPHEWLSWSRPHVNLKHLPFVRQSLNDLQDVWVRTWAWQNGEWVRGPQTIGNVFKDRYATRFNIDVPQGSMLLQVGSQAIPWRFVSLPPGPVKIAISINASAEGQQHPLRIVVSRGRPDEEVLLSFLAKNDLGAAADLIDSPRTAERLLFNKYNDPISACVGAYFLLRVNDIERMHDWPENLFQNFEWLPDAAVIYATTLLRRRRPDFTDVLAKLEIAFDHGLPIYREGVTLMNENLQLISGSKYRSSAAEKLLNQVSKYVLAQIGQGSALSFLGQTPRTPSPIPRVGLPNRPRRIDPYRARNIARYQDASDQALARTPQLAQPRVAYGAKKRLTHEKQQDTDQSVLYLYGPKAK